MTYVDQPAKPYQSLLSLLEPADDFPAETTGVDFCAEEEGLEMIHDRIDFFVM